jgi:hypothetical protein
VSIPRFCKMACLSGLEKLDFSLKRLINYV